MVSRGGLVLDPTHYEAPIRDRRPNLNRASMLFLLPAVAELLLLTTQSDGVGPNNPLIQNLFAVAVVAAFIAAMIALLLTLALFAEAISPTAASRLERAAAVGSVTALLIASALLLVSVAVAGD